MVARLRRSAWPALLAALATLVACAQRADDSRPVVAVSVAPQAWFVKRIAGERVRVLVMVPPGASPVTHAPTLAQMRALSEAVLYVRVGHPAFPFEAAWLERVLSEMDGLRILDTVSQTRAGTDPHVWLDPERARELARNVADALVELLPADREALLAALDPLLAEIDAVEAELRARLEPLRGGAFMVFHPAWNPLTARYGLEQIAIEADGKEPSAPELARLIEMGRRRGVRVIFAQPHFDPASAAAVAREIGARVELIDPLAYEWADNLREVARSLSEGVVR